MLIVNFLSEVRQLDPANIFNSTDSEEITSDIDGR